MSHKSNLNPLLFIAGAIAGAAAGVAAAIAMEPKNRRHVKRVMRNVEVEVDSFLQDAGRKVKHLQHEVEKSAKGFLAEHQDEISALRLRVDELLASSEVDEKVVKELKSLRRQLNEALDNVQEKSGPAIREMLENISRGLRRVEQEAEESMDEEELL